MQDKKFHLFAWLDCGPYPSSEHSGVMDLYIGSFSSIEDAQNYFNDNCKDDNAEIIIAQDGEMLVVATGIRWQSGWKKKVFWEIETKRITNPPPAKEEKQELLKPVIGKNTARNMVIMEQVKNA